MCIIQTSSCFSLVSCREIRVNTTWDEGSFPSNPLLEVAMKCSKSTTITIFTRKSWTFYWKHAIITLCNIKYPPWFERIWSRKLKHCRRKIQVNLKDSLIFLYRTIGILYNPTDSNVWCLSSSNLFPPSVSRIQFQGAPLTNPGTSIASTVLIHAMVSCTWRCWKEIVMLVLRNEIHGRNRLVPTVDRIAKCIATSYI